MVAPSAGGSLLPWQRTPTTNPFLRNSNKNRWLKRATNTHKHGRSSYLSVGTGGDVQTLLEAEPLRSKDRGLFTYNIDYVISLNRYDLKKSHTSQRCDYPLNGYCWIERILARRRHLQAGCHTGGCTIQL